MCVCECVSAGGEKLFVVDYFSILTKLTIHIRLIAEFVLLSSFCFIAIVSSCCIWFTHTHTQITALYCCYKMAVLIHLQMNIINDFELNWHPTARIYKVDRIQSINIHFKLSLRYLQTSKLWSTFFIAWNWFFIPSNYTNQDGQLFCSFLQSGCAPVAVLGRHQCPRRWWFQSSIHSFFRSWIDELHVTRWWNDHSKS